ncbi:MAG: hypothetical protein PVI26_10290 [Chitinispirillia bacterium]|jgi:pectate lyase
MDRLQFLLILIILTLRANFLSASDEPEGFASCSGKGLQTTTGGYGGDTVSATTGGDLKKYLGLPEPLVVLLKGQIKIGAISVKSNKTILGFGKTAAVVGEGFHVINQSNIIFRNLSFLNSRDDGIQMDNCHHIWIDHCYFTNGGDGLIDSRKNTTNLTVSWCILSDHDKTFGIGWTNNVTAEITIHHTWFKNSNQRNPSGDNILRAHLYNNLLEDITTYGNFCRGGTNMIIENTVYKNVAYPHFVQFPDIPVKPSGSLKVTGCIYEGKIQGDTIHEYGKPFFNPKDFYNYTLDPAEKVRSLLTHCAGPQVNFDCEDITAEIKNLGIVQNRKPAVSFVSDRSVLLKFPRLRPEKVSIYSSNGTLQFRKSSTIGKTLRWEAPMTGLYYIQYISNNKKKDVLKVLIID